MEFKFNDGGREAAGYVGKARDCVCRSISIASGLPYQQVYSALAEGNSTQRKSKHSKDRPKSANNGIQVTRKWFKDYMKSIGFTWIATMTIGSGCKVHLRKNELPLGKLVVSVSKHYTAVIDGVVNDTQNPERTTGRCVYGYWIAASSMVDC